MKTKVIIVKSFDKKYYINYFNSGDEYYKSAFKTLEGAKNVIKNQNLELIGVFEQ